MEQVTLALWATNLGQPLVSLDEWIDQAIHRIEEAAAGGVDLIMLPEWVAAHFLAFAPPGLEPAGEVAFMAAQAPKALAALADAVWSTGITLLAGSMPAAQANGFVNRAHLITPGATYTQDKLCLTPWEQRADGWLVRPGDALKIIPWRGLRLAIAVCLDVEQPALAARLQQAKPDLLLVPSMTDLASGYTRVFACARARAIELMCPVAVVGTVGVQRINGLSEPNTSGAAVYVPAEPELGSTGIFAEHPMTTECVGLGPLLIARGVPVGQCRRLRGAGAGAEAWPGPWSADHVRIEE
ncbi:MAG: nitrilase [Proteobacteria bacterium]|nr:nitrilase [Pseudomonadota bacterium]